MTRIFFRTHNTFLDFASTAADSCTDVIEPSSSKSTATTAGTRLRRTSSDPVLVSDSEQRRRSVSEVCTGWYSVSPMIPQGVRRTCSIDVVGGRKEANHKIFVGGLSPMTEDIGLYQFMSQFGCVKNVAVKKNPANGLSRRYAFVKFYHPPLESVFQHSWTLDGNVIRISKYQVSPSWKNHYYSDEEQI
jgi:hypothetical protein